MSCSFKGLGSRSRRSGANQQTLRSVRNGNFVVVAGVVAVVVLLVVVVIVVAIVVGVFVVVEVLVVVAVALRCQ